MGHIGRLERLISLPNASGGGKPVHPGSPARYLPHLPSLADHPHHRQPRAAVADNAGESRRTRPIQESIRGYWDGVQ